MYAYNQYHRMICDHYFGLLLSMLVLRHNATCRNNGISWVDASWLVVDLPLWRMMEFVSWDDEIPNIWKNKIHFPNHQLDINSMHTLWILYTKSNRALFCNLLKKTPPWMQIIFRTWKPSIPMAKNRRSAHEAAKQFEAKLPRYPTYWRPFNVVKLLQPP